MASLRCKNIIFDNIRAVFWDKDGTLANSHQFLRELAQVRSRYVSQVSPDVEQPLLAAFGCRDDRYDPAGLMAVGTRYENEIAAATYIAATGKPWVESLHLAKTAFVESDRHFTRKADFTPPFTGIAALLKSWHRRGLTMAVVSGDTTSNIEDFLQRYELANHIDWFAGSEAPPVKPDPEMVWRACEQFGISPQECLVIGDSELDDELARNSGVRGFVSVTWGGSPAIAGADAIVDSVDQLTLKVESRFLQ
jgi:phosphoglycolate phosphatase